MNPRTKTIAAITAIIAAIFVVVALTGCTPTPAQCASEPATTHTLAEPAGFSSSFRAPSFRAPSFRAPSFRAPSAPRQQRISPKVPSAPKANKPAPAKKAPAKKAPRSSSSSSHTSTHSSHTTVIHQGGGDFWTFMTFAWLFNQPHQLPQQQQVCQKAGN